MPINETENSIIRNYLLGKTSSINDEFEEKLMTDEGFFKEFQIQEEELIQDYVDGDLTDFEKQKFESHFLISAERQEKLKFAQTLREHIDLKIDTQDLKEQSVEISDDIEPSFFSFDLFKKLIPTFAVLLITFGLIWFFYISSNETIDSPLEQEYAKLNSENLKGLESYESKVNLISGNPRSNTNIRELNKSDLAEKVLFRLALPSKMDSTKKFIVKVLKDQKVIFTQKEIRLYNNESNGELRLLLPAKLFEKGEYRISIQNDDMKDSRISYTFLVE